jgi:hypothetical protein
VNTDDPYAINFPAYRKTLLTLLHDDQNDLRQLGNKLSRLDSLERKLSAIKPVAYTCQKRAEQVLGILDVIKEPTANNIGMDGSEAIIILTVHSNLKMMKKVLVHYQKVFADNPTNLAADAIPLLIDRISILKDRTQIFGTMWLDDGNGEIFLVPVRDFMKVNERRMRYGLPPLQRPSISGKKRRSTNRPINALAQESDQREIPEDVYQLNFAYMDVDLLSRRDKK